ncbi:large ribosomal subunit protein bL21m [Palaemon carinicauda]|uniref:large ribosomal subunit protein bL21m n=1 Tax=Palaemon carinicauda TaxID=392227 RepID=UPI0035B58850
MFRPIVGRLCRASFGLQRSLQNEFVASRGPTLPMWMQVNGLRTPSHTSYVNHPFSQQEIVDDTMVADETSTKIVIDKVNQQIANGQCGRLFAVVYLASLQHLVTPEDLLIIEGTFAPNLGDKIRLEKVLCVGGRDFTLYGRPLLSKDLVYVEATVIEKNLSHSKIHFFSLRRNNKRRTKFHRSQQTLLRINTVKVMHKINEVKDVEGVDGRIF